MKLLVAALSDPKLGAYLTSLGLVGLATYNASIGDYAGALTAFGAAFGLHRAANSGPATK